MEPGGIEPRTIPTSRVQDADSANVRATPRAMPTDSTLIWLIQCWPDLADDVRESIIETVRGAMASRVDDGRRYGSA